MVILLMGVSGSGKTTIGTRLAQELRWTFADGDDYHPAANIQKMKNGIPLTDEDRAPWLLALHNLIARWLSEGTEAVLACSALRKAYRCELQISSEVRPVYLKASPEVLRARLRERAGHYMKEGMLASQLATLEEPDDAVVIEVNGTIEDNLQQIRQKLGR